MQVFVGDMHRRVVGVVGLPDDRSLIATGLQMAVDAVGGDVQRPVGKPVDGDIAQRVVDVLDLCEGFDPVDAPGLLAPEAFGILERCRLHRFVACRIHMGVGRHVGRGRVGFCGCGGVGHESSSLGS